LEKQPPKNQLKKKRKNRLASRETKAFVNTNSTFWEGEALNCIVIFGVPMRNFLPIVILLSFTKDFQSLPRTEKYSVTEKLYL